MFGNGFNASLLMAAIVALFGVVGADSVGAESGGHPEAFAGALDKIERYAKGAPWTAAERHPETALRTISNRLLGGGGAESFSMHPANWERVARLLAMAR